MISSFLSSSKNISLGISSACMIGRPVITMSNDKIPMETRKYTASREFFTEVFNMSIIYSLVTLAENFAFKNVAKKQGLKFSKELFKKVTETGWENLLPKEQKIKTAFALTSFLGTAATVAIITPLLNNAFLDKIINLLPIGKSNKQDKDTQPNQIATSNQTNVFQKFNQLKLNG